MEDTVLRNQPWLGYRANGPIFFPHKGREREREKEVPCSQAEHFSRGEEPKVMLKRILTDVITNLIVGYWPCVNFFPVWTVCLGWCLIGLLKTILRWTVNKHIDGLILLLSFVISSPFMDWRLLHQIHEWLIWGQKKLQRQTMVYMGFNFLRVLRRGAWSWHLYYSQTCRLHVCIHVPTYTHTHMAPQ